MWKNTIFTRMMIIVSALILGYINFRQGYKSILIFMKDNNIILSKEAIFNRIFINTDFVYLEYMEGNSLFHFISPFIFYVISIFWGSFSYLKVKKNYHQFLHSRTKLQKQSLRILRGSYIKVIVLFNTVYIFTILFLIYFSQLNFEHRFIDLIKVSGMMILSSTLISIGISSISFYFYLKYEESISLLVTFILIISIFIVNLKMSKISVVFIGQDAYFTGGIIIGLALILISLALINKVKYEVY